MAARKVTITIEGDGPGADAALDRLIEVLRLTGAPPDGRPPGPKREPEKKAA